MDRNEGEAAFAAEIHQRLLAGDPVATADLCEHYVQSLYRRLHGKWPNLDEGFLSEAIANALLDYGKRPDRFDPSRKSLRGFLFMVADRNANNKYRQEKRYRDNVVPFCPVENDDEPGKTGLGRTEDFVDDLLDRQMAEESRANALALCETKEERIVAQLMLGEEKNTAVFAQALGLTGLSWPEQQRQIFRIKDRITRRWERARGDIHHV